MLGLVLERAGGFKLALVQLDQHASIDDTEDAWIVVQRRVQVPGPR